MSDGDEPAGVFGNLPRTRPGSRSPMRDAGATRPRPAPRAAPSTPAEGPPATPPPPEPQASDPSPPRPDAPQGGGIEDVAWAGVAAAAEAATIGVRLATRALEAMRDAVDRR